MSLAITGWKFPSLVLRSQRGHLELSLIWGPFNSDLKIDECPIFDRTKPLSHAIMISIRITVLFSFPLSISPTNSLRPKLCHMSDFGSPWVVVYWLHSSSFCPNCYIPQLNYVNFFLIYNLIDTFLCLTLIVITRVEVYLKNNVRLAVKSGEEIIFVRFAIFSVERFFHRIHRSSCKKGTAVSGFEPLTSWMSPISDSTAPCLTYFNNISCQFKTSGEISVEYL